MRLRASLPGFVESMLTALWAGGLWVVGFAVAPAFFRITDDRLLSGRFAGAAFETLGALGLVCGVLLLVLAVVRRAPHRRAVIAVLAAMLALTAVGQFALHPAMAALRDAADGLATAAGRARFSFLHGLSMGLFVINSLLAAVLVWLGLSRSS